MSHPDYKKDSVVSQEINYDLLKAVDEMCVMISLILCKILMQYYRERGARKAPDLLPADYEGGNKDRGSIGL